MNPVSDNPVATNSGESQAATTPAKPKGNRNRGGRGSKPDATAATKPKDEKPMMNPVLRNAMVPIIKGRMAEADFELVTPVDGLTLVKPTSADVGVTMPSLAKFPLAYSQHSGRLTGKLMNIAQYCRAQTGKAWNDRHKDKIKEEEGKVVMVLKDEGERARLSKELDEMRPKFYATLKGEAASFIARQDAEVQRGSFRQTARGIVLTATAVIPFAKDNELLRLRQKLEQQEAYIANLEGHVPSKTRNNIKSKLKEKPVNIDTIVQQTAEESAEAINRLTKANAEDKTNVVPAAS